MLTRVEKIEETEPDDAFGGGFAYPNLRHVRLFEKAAACGSLSRAAADVHVSQPAATQAISRLESQFGVQLLVRASSGISLTDRGAIVVNRFRRALGLLRRANQDLARQSRVGKVPAPDLLETHATVAHLRALSAFADAGSFSGAGRLLDQAESSVHRAARQFERIGSVPLFEEQSRHLRLTPTGRMLAVHASLFLDEIVCAHEELREYEGSFAGRLRIGTLPLVRTTILPRVIARICEAFPDAAFEVNDGDYVSQLAALKAGRIDMLVGALRPDNADPALQQEELFRDTLCVIAGRGHPLLAQEKVARDDLARFPWIVSREGTPTRAIFDRLALSRPGDLDQPAVPVVAGSSVIVRGLLLETDRLTILSPHQMEHEIAAGLLGIVPYRLDNTERAIGLTVRQGWQPTALQRAVMEQLREQCAV